MALFNAPILGLGRDLEKASVAVAVKPDDGRAAAPDRGLDGVADVVHIGRDGRHDFFRAQHRRAGGREIFDPISFLCRNGFGFCRRRAIFNGGGDALGAGEGLVAARRIAVVMEIGVGAVGDPVFAIERMIFQPVQRQMGRAMEGRVLVGQQAKGEMDAGRGFTATL